MGTTTEAPPKSAAWYKALRNNKMRMRTQIDQIASHAFVRRRRLSTTSENYAGYKKFKIYGWRQRNGQRVGGVPVTSKWYEMESALKECLALGTLKCRTVVCKNTRYKCRLYK